MARWKAGFRKPLVKRALKFSSSLEIDKRLYREDIAGSIAHAEMLAECDIIPASDARKIVRALKAIEKEISSGKFSFAVGCDGRFTAEDIHMAIEQRLIQKIGATGGKLHTARSRNDQVALDVRLWLRGSIHSMMNGIRALQRGLVATAEDHIDVIMPGYTHLQRAQPILLAHHLLAHVEMFERDRRRLADCLKRANLSPLGAAALAGTSYPIDRRSVAKKMGFAGIVENSIDAVTDRDALLECMSACAIIMMHLSRFAEEFILWTSQEWHFAAIGEAFTTGSSIMPQKKNPDMAELVRGKTGRVYGDLLGLLTTMKGLPLAYNRDMQEDKEALFDAVDTTADCLAIITAMLRTVTFDRGRFAGELRSDFLLATELADYLVRKGLPFRDAHGVVGEIVRNCQERKSTLDLFTLAEFRRFSPLFGKDVASALDLHQSLERKKSAGSTSPTEVRRAIRKWKIILNNQSLINNTQ